MPLSAGTKLGPYEILVPIGAGGMGEVYRARDTTLKRDVALKVLPADFSNSPERMARFQREAEVLASLDHPNIGHIHGIVEAGDTRALALALIEGPTLADRIAAGPIALEEALVIAKQIIEALEYAHDRGIVHRDLKPANIKINTDGVVKVLDFGLAKVLEDEPAASSFGNSPTLTIGHTRAGMILGTASYMSPEQAVGRPVDRRSDIFSFGAVLYEMLTGQRAFAGTTTPDVLEAVVKSDPDWGALPGATPSSVVKLIRRCLTKDRKQRVQAIGEARITLENLRQEEPTAVAQVTAPVQSRLGWLWPAVAATFVLTTVVLAFLYLRQRPPTMQVGLFQIPAEDRALAGGNLNLGGISVSPDGSRLIFISGDGANARLLMRRMDALATQPIDGTEGVGGTPFWSWNSRFIVFSAGGKLKKIEASGGPAQPLCDVQDVVSGGFWTSDNKIVFGGVGGLRQVPSAGGAATPVTASDTSDGAVADAFPSLLPDGRHFVYTHQENGPGNGGIYLGSLDAKPEEQRKKRLLADVSHAVFAPGDAGGSIDGYLLFLRGVSVGALVNGAATGPPKLAGTLMAQPFDAGELALVGDAVPVAEQVQLLGFSASTNNVLVYRAGDPFGQIVAAAQNLQLTWFDRQGKPSGTAGEPGLYSESVLSPDGKQLALSRFDLQSLTGDLYVLDFARGGSRHLTFDPGSESSPVWSPDSSHLAFRSGPTGNPTGPTDLYQKASNGTGEQELLFKSDASKTPTSWSRDSRFLMFTSIDPKTKSDLWALPMAASGKDARKPVLFLSTAFNETQGQFSPDTRWIAYTSDESGRQEVYARPFDAAHVTQSPGGPKWQVSTDGGSDARWRADGKELYYSAPDGNLMAVEIPPATDAEFRYRVATKLFKLPASPGSPTGFAPLGDVDAKGQKFLMPVPQGGSAAPPPSRQSPFTVVLNWTALLKR